jgi:hypothetical protein
MVCPLQHGARRNPRGRATNNDEKPMRLSTLLSRTLASCAVVGALTLGAPAQATTLTNTSWLVAGSPVLFNLHWGANSRNNVQTGGFQGDFGDPPPGQHIEFWCFDLDHFFSLGTTYSDYTAIQLTGAMATELAELFQADGGVRTSDANHSAGFQLAIWNILYDSDLTVSTGSFNATGNATAISYANFLLGDLHNHDGSQPSITELVSQTRPDHHQNFITPNEVPRECCINIPEPPVLPLVLTAFGAFALIETRRRMRVRGG